MDIIELMKSRTSIPWRKSGNTSACKRFRRQCQRDGVLAEIKKREFYEKPSVKRKKKMLAARRRRA